MSNRTRDLRRLLARVLDVLMPQDCLVCGEAARACGVCAACLAEMPRRPPSACPVCALPGLDGGPCGQCLRQPPAYDATLALFDYVFPVDVLVLALKYRHQLSVATFLATELRVLGEQIAADVDFILPMPLHARRLAERGFNQAVELARPLAREQALPMELACVRKLRDTPPQASLSRDERLLSPAGAFRCDRALDGLHVLVVDDVMTTGATLDELARCLKAQGAARVTNLVVARTPAPA
ncbi:ComF family protein [Thauera butanivorans]|uniref:ComF family protein n=1 Tax=Thauera butanivorans TaxID=86174 RepID=UPI003AB5AAB0